MKAFYYDIQIQPDPIRAYTQRTIKEIYIKDVNIYMNRECIFSDNEARFNEAIKDSISEIELNHVFVNMLVAKLNNDELIKEKQQSVFDELIGDICKGCKYLSGDNCLLESKTFKRMYPDLTEKCPYKLEKIVIEQKEDDEKV